MYADPLLQKVAYDAFFEELAEVLASSRSKTASVLFEDALDAVFEAVGADYVKTASDAELEELVKLAFIGQLVKRFPVLGMNAGAGLKQIGSQAAAAGGKAFNAVKPTNVASRLASSSGEFSSGMGRAMQEHLTHSPVMSRIGLPGTYAGAATKSLGGMASDRLAQVGGRMANTAPVGSLRERFGARLMNSSLTGGVRTATTKVAPAVGHVAGNVAAGALGVPMAGAIAGKGALALGAKGLGALGVKGFAGQAAGELVGHAAEHGAHGIGSVMGHAAQDVVGDHVLHHGGTALKKITPARGMQVVGAAPAPAGVVG